MKLLQKNRGFVLQCIDMALWMAACQAAIVLTGAFVLQRVQVFLVVLAMHLVIYHLAGLYQTIWRYAGARQLVKCVSCEAVTWLLLLLGSALVFHWRIGTFSVMGFFCASTFILSSRMLYIALITARRGGIRAASDAGERTLIIGAGEAAGILLADMQRDEAHLYAPVGMVDDDPAKRGRRIRNVKVFGPIDELEKFAAQLDVSLIVFAIFNLSEDRRRAILEYCAATGCKIRMAPSVRELEEVGAGVSRRLRNVEINDLLGRTPVLLDKREAEKYLRGRRVLVTGGGGSIGSELCRQIAAMEPEELVILDVYENGAYDIQQELVRQYGDSLNLSVEILSVCDSLQLDRVFRSHRPQVVFHAAAHKHVPLMENAAEEAVKNNVFGTRNVALLADKYGVDRFVLISTDKAVNPTNIMGATKRCCELVIQGMNQKSKTEYVAVRFGNVLGSNGSVIPLFSKQIAEGGPVTVTDPEVIRYFMTIPEAVRLLLTAGSMARGGEIFILDMGKPVKILDLAKKMIALSGLQLGRDIQIKFTGLRPGEKRFEELLLSEEGTQKTVHDKIFVAEPPAIDGTAFWDELAHLQTAAQWGNQEAILRGLGILVPTYHPAAPIQAPSEGEADKYAVEA